MNRIRKDSMTEISLNLYVASDSLNHLMNRFIQTVYVNNLLIQNSLNSYVAMANLIHFNESVRSDSLCE